MSKFNHVHDPANNPDCMSVFAQLSNYLDGDLTLDDCAAVEEHIADCPPCIEFLEGLKSSIAASHRFQTAAVPPPISSEVSERLKQAWAAAVARRRQST